MFAQLVDGIFWDIALWVFAIGVLWRILSIFRFGSKPDYSDPRGSAAAGAIGANLRRFMPRSEMVSAYPPADRCWLPVSPRPVCTAVLCRAARPVHEAQTGLGWTPMPYWALSSRRNCPLSV